MVETAELPLDKTADDPGAEDSLGTLLSEISSHRLLTPAEEVLLAKRIDRKSTRLNSSHIQKSRMPSSA